MNLQDPKTREALAPFAAAVGFVGGLLAWNVLLTVLAALREDLPRSVVQAREMGLVSFTVLAGYDKSQESVAWILGCIVVPVATWALWYAVRPAHGAAFRVGRRRRRQRREEEETPDEEEGERRGPDRRGPPAWVPWTGLLAAVVAVAARPGFLRGPSPWGSFGLLGEEGVYLGAVQGLQTGRVLYTDIEFPYGPLLIYPLDLWMRVFGDTVVVARSWVLLLHLAGIVAAAAAIRMLLGPRTGPWAALAAGLALALAAPLFLPNLNGVLLRPVLALLPGAMLLAAGRRAWFRRMDAAEGEPPPGDNPLRCPFVATGAVTAVAALFSFEVGPAAVVGLGISAWVTRPSRGQALRVAAGGVVVGAAVLVPMAFSGSLGGMFDQMGRMLTLPALGYQALPYPDPAALFEDGGGAFGAYPPADGATLLWAVVPPLVIWLGLAIGLCGPRRGGVPTRNGALLVAAGVAAVLFRAALGRSDLYHLWFYGAVPVVVISTLVLERAWGVVVAEFRPLVPCVGAMIVVGLVSAGAEKRVRFPDEEEERLGAAAGLDNPLVPRDVSVPRAGRLRLLPRLTGQVDAIVQRASRLPPGDGVWFYPSEATYYFLTNRALPNRYLWAYDAATPRMQDIAVAELERSRPRWLFRSADTFPIDHIPQDRLVPKIDSYLKAHYRPVEVLPGATLMERVE